MNVINHNAETDLSPAQILFVTDIVECLDDVLLHEMDVIDWRKIPVFLVDPLVLDELKESQEDRFGRRKYIQDYAWKEVSARPATDVLGLYCPERSRLHVGRHIVIATDRILECAEGDPFRFITLAAKVILHEFGHALLDDCGKTVDSRDDIHSNRIFEESLANMLALWFFDRYCGTGDGFHAFHRSSGRTQGLNGRMYDYVREFISGQPFEYRLGLRLYDSRIWFWESWRDRRLHPISAEEIRRLRQGGLSDDELWKLYTAKS